MHSFVGFIQKRGQKVYILRIYSMFTKLKIRLLSYGYHTVMLRLYYGKGSIWYRKRNGNGVRMGQEWNDRTARMGGTYTETLAAN